MLKRLLSLLAQAWIILGISVLLLFLSDQLLRLVLPAPATDAPVDAAMQAPPREQADAVAADGWITQYWREHAASRYTEWHSYVYWRRRGYAGELIHIDAHGFRQTPHVQPRAERHIWLFGGSTVWGTGNRDSGTLAAQLEQIYLERAPELGVRVDNFGESGYVSRQSLTAFQSALNCPEAPADLAIFLDGANDVFAALQSGVAGLPQNEDNRRREFNSSRQAGQLLRSWLLRLEGIMRLAGVSSSAITEADLPALAQAITNHYFSQIKQAQALAMRFDVDLIYLWQPTAFDRNQPRGDEANIVGASSALHVQLQRLSTQQVATLHQSAQLAPILPLADLPGIFDDTPEPVFFDFVHLSEAGQRILAEQLYALSVEKLRQRTARQLPLDRCPDRPLG
ncbi:MAG: SGNH/GDSL hydrolase family protein [Lysobacterales bacterium]